MRKYLVIVSLVIGIVSLGLLFGCAQTTETTTTTCAATTTTAAATTTTTSTTTTTAVKISSLYVNTAKAAAALTAGSSTTGKNAAAIGSAGSSTPTLSLSILSVKNFAQQGGPPESFFTTNLANSSDGYMTITTEAFMTPSLRMYLKNGNILAGSTVFSGKKIAKFGTFEVRDLMGGAPGQQNLTLEAAILNFITLFSAEAAPYNSSEVFKQNFTSPAEYIAWAMMYPSMLSGWKQRVAGPYTFSTPEATASDLIATLECKMAFSKYTTGEISIQIATTVEGGGEPVPGIYTGNGTLTIPGGTLAATALMNFSGAPHNVSMNGMSISGTITPGNNKLYTTMNPTSMTGSGLISNEAGTLLATMELTSTGVTIYWIGPPATKESYGI